jgi:hypothetical protein
MAHPSPSRGLQETTVTAAGSAASEGIYKLALAVGWRWVGAVKRQRWRTASARRAWRQGVIIAMAWNREGCRVSADGMPVESASEAGADSDDWVGGGGRG